MEELIRQCQQGDRASMGRLYTLMHDELLAHCRKYAVNDNAAEDLLHDAFLLIFSHIDKVHSPEKARHWMHKVVRNVCLLYMQHRQNHTLLSIDDVHETAQGMETDLPVTYNDILKAVDQLPQGYRQVFRLSVLEGLAHQQIAELLGIEPHTSSSQLLRAKRQLRQLLHMLMLFVLAALPFGSYYFWVSHREEQAVYTAEDTTASQPITSVLYANAENTDSHQASVSKPMSAVNEDIVVNEGIVVKEDTPIVKDDAVVKEDAHVTENNPMEEIAPMTENVPVVKDDIVVKNKVRMTPPHLTLSLAYSGLPDADARQLPYGAADMNGDIDSVTHHRLPVTLALHIRYGLGARWWLDGGLHYTLLSSETRVGNTYLNMNRQQHVRYLGLSVGVGRELWHQRRWNLYATTAVSCELPLHSTAKTTYWQGGQLVDKENSRLAPHSQWSVGIGVGLQYNLTPAIGFFAEPSLQYYFHHSGDISTWRTEHPFTPALPLGIRLSF